MIFIFWFFKTSKKTS